MKLFCAKDVASFTDAWIETLKYSRDFIQLPVASFTDAWIETGLMRTELLGGTSHLLQMRGLKLVQQWRAFGVYVASFTDAWIETLPSKGIQ